MFPLQWSTIVGHGNACLVEVGGERFGGIPILDVGFGHIAEFPLGMKLGLCNVVILLVLLLFGWKEAALVSAARVVVIGFLFGNLFSIAYSMGGAMLSILVMAILIRTGKFHETGISAAGGAAHNIGQILVAYLVTPQLPLLWYLPILMIAGLITGILIGFAVWAVLLRIQGIVVQK